MALGWAPLLFVLAQEGRIVVAKNKKYDIIDRETGRLDRHIFVDQQVYDDEMEKIFGRS